MATKNEKLTAAAKSIEGDTFSVALMLRKIGDEFIFRYSNTFGIMMDNLSIDTYDLKDELHTLLNVACEPGISWGRIAGIIAFTALLLVKAIDHQNRNVFSNLIQQTLQYPIDMD